MSKYMLTLLGCIAFNSADPNLGVKKEAKDIKEFLEMKREEEKQQVNYVYPFIRDQQPSSIKLKGAP